MILKHVFVKQRAHYFNCLSLVHFGLACILRFYSLD